MAEDSRFCVRCGAIIPDGSSFCGECGLPIDGNQSDNSRFSNSNIGVNTKELGSIPIMILLYGLIMAAFSLLGMLFITNFDQLIQALKDMAEQMSGDQKQQMLEYISQLVALFTAQVRQLYMALGTCTLISGIAALVSGAYASKMRKWRAAFIFCIIATALSAGTASLLITPVLVIAGAYMCYRINKAKDLFSS